MKENIFLVESAGQGTANGSCPLSIITQLDHLQGLRLAKDFYFYFSLKSQLPLYT
jgi:hypothetical protein